MDAGSGEDVPLWYGCGAGGNKCTGVLGMKTDGGDEGAV